MSSISVGNGLPFGRTFGNCLRGLALTVLREQGRAMRWRLVREPFVGLTESKLIYEEVPFVGRVGSRIGIEKRG